MANSRLKLHAKETFLNDGKHIHDLQVVGMYMYLRDECYNRVGLLHVYEEYPTNFLYDIELSDSTHRLKCFLAPKMYHAVQTGKLRLGTTVRIKQTCIVGNHIVLQDFDITGIEDVPDASSLPYLPHVDTREILPQPLYATRSYYLNLWLPSILYGSNWTNVAPSLVLSPDFRNSSFITLNDLSKRFHKMKSPYPPLLVTVLQCGELLHYGKPGFSNPCPFYSYLLLADRSGICGAILWGRRNMGTHWHIKIGDSLLLKNYNIKVCYMYKQYRHRYERPEIVPLELKLEQKSLITLVKNDDIPQRIKNNSKLYPSLYPVFRFVPRNLLGSIYHGTDVDVVGFVTYVGHCVRVKVPYPKWESWQWMAYRWIEMLDDSSKLPIRVKLRLNYQLNEPGAITLGQTLICTHLRVVRRNTDSSFDRVQFYLKSTNESQTLFSPPNEADIMREYRMQEFQRWMVNSRDYLQQIQNLLCRIGGYSFHWYQEEKPDGALKRAASNTSVCESADSRSVPVLQGKHWKCALDSLEVRERKSFVVCGTVTQVTYVRVDGVLVALERLYKSSLGINEDPLTSENWHLAFPLLYSSDFKDELQSFLALPAFSSEQLLRTRPVTREQFEALPYFLSEGYIVEIQSDDHPVSLSTVFIPMASRHPHPSLENFLKKRYQTKGLFSDDECYIETAAYAPEQNDRISETVKEIEGRRFHFKVDFYSYEANKAVAILIGAL